MDGPTSDQIQAALEVVEGVLGESLVAVYLYGSAVAGGLRPTSDIDLLVVLSRPTRSTERRDLVEQLIPISRRERRPADWRPLELTVVVASDLKPWRLPPRTDFQYGEWMQFSFDEKYVDPWDPHNPDLVVLIEMVRRTGLALRGAPAIEVLPEVPADDLKRSLLGVVSELLNDLDPDTANVLLTLARVWHTLETGEFTSKDAAADWAITRLDSTEPRPLEWARDTYLGTTSDQSADIDAYRELAARLVAEIEQYRNR